MILNLPLWEFSTGLKKEFETAVVNEPSVFEPLRGWSGGAMVLRVNFQCRGVLLIWIIVGQGSSALAVGASGVFFGHFFSRLSFFFLSLSGRRPDID